MQAQEGLLTPGEAAKYLGVNVATLRRWSIRGKIPVFRLSDRIYRYDRGEIIAWLHEKQIKRTRANAEYEKAKERSLAEMEVS